MPEQTQYAAASQVPLIKSPSLRVPKAILLPPDIHPLPHNVTDYFVYQFSLEPLVIAMETSRRSTIASHTARREAYIQSREEEKERRKREALRRIAPGFEPQGSVLVPTRPAATTTGTQSAMTTASREQSSVMEDLVDQLARLESSRS